VDEYDLVHLGFRLLLTSRPEVERCVPAHDAEEALDAARRYAPHVAIVDLGVADGSGAELAMSLRDAAPGARLVLLSGTRTMPVSAAKRIGASALLPKRTRAVDMVQVVAHVAAGGEYFSQPGVGPMRLSPRECEVLALIARGETNREIAAELHLSPGTVKQHAAAIYRKLGVRNRTEAARRGDALGVTALTAQIQAEAA